MRHSGKLYRREILVDFPNALDQFARKLIAFWNPRLLHSKAKPSPIVSGFPFSCKRSNGIISEGLKLVIYGRNDRPIFPRLHAFI